MHPDPTHLLVPHPPNLPSTLTTSFSPNLKEKNQKPTQTKQSKASKNKKTNETKTGESHHESCVWPPIYTINPFVLSRSFSFTFKCSLPLSLVWFKASGIYHTIDDGLSLGLLLDSLFPCVMEILKFWICKFVLYTRSNRWGGCRMDGPTQPCFWAWACQPGQLSAIVTTQVRCPALPWLAHSNSSFL